ncbi:MAG TPA: deoxyribose-phosphate aldolase [Nitriliruptoraceae bacterium]|nr:deoxyribose-phosphate aldolase [Nitriliruptoraceae bacterium]
MTLTVPSAPPELAEATANEAALRQFLHGLRGVDKVGLEARVASLATRSLKKDTKLAGIDLAISMVDLTTLEGNDTLGKVQALAAKAIRPDPLDASCPSAAAVCVYPDLVAPAVAALEGSSVVVAAVATAFPAGRSSMEVKLADTRLAVDAGASEVDMVIDRGAFLMGDYGTVFEEIVAAKQACGDTAKLKVIIETGELGTYDNVRRASWLALAAGGDVIKTSTGKIKPASTRPFAAVMLQAVRDFERLTGHRRGVKAAGGIRTTKDALRYLVLVNEIAGPAWLDPALFRFGASSLLDDLLLQRTTQRTGRYHSTTYVPIA